MTWSEMIELNHGVASGHYRLKECGADYMRYAKMPAPRVPQVKHRE